MKRLRKIFLRLLLSIIALFGVVLVTAVYFWNTNQCGDNPGSYLKLSKSYLLASGLKSINANGMRFVYRETGTGPLVLLIHGFPGFGSTYNDIAPRIAQTGYRVVEYAQRGYAPSDIPAGGDYSMFALGRDVLALIDALGAEKAYVVGHDWGATAAYGAAILGPEKIKRMVTIAVPHPATAKPSLEGLKRAPHFFLLQFGLLSEWMASNSNFIYLENLVGDIQGSWNTPSSQINSMKQDLSNPERLRAMICYYRSLRAHPEQIEQLENNQIKIPTLTINSADSAMFGAVSYAKSAKYYDSQFELSTIKSVGHFIPQQAPDKVARAILEFFGSNMSDKQGTQELTDQVHRAKKLNPVARARPFASYPVLRVGKLTGLK